MEYERDIATAPGDLPAEMVMRRLASAAGQFRHENTLSPLWPRPGDSVTVTAFSGAHLPLREASLFYTVDGSLPEDNSSSIPMSARLVEFVPLGEYTTRWECTLPSQPDGAWVRYRIEGITPDGSVVRAQDGQGFWFRYPSSQSVTLFSYRVCSRQHPPSWFRDAVIYQIFTDRFHGQTRLRAGLREKHGGTLRGITDSLPYISELGVSCLWLSPINIAPSYHRYDATDLCTVDPDLGTVEDLRSLVAACHRQSIRVILDFVPSHLSDRHPAFLDAVRSPDSPYADWFTFYDWPHRYRSFLENVPSLVSINTESVGAREHLKKAARYWIEECDVDGYRIDHVIGHGMDFWNDLQQDLQSLKSDVVTLAEATDTGDALVRYAGRLTSILDFPVARALRLAFATEHWSLSQLDAYLSQYERFMANGPARASFLDNHDMERFLFLANQDTHALALAALCLLTLPPTPVIYYGTEIGMTHEFPFENLNEGGDAQARKDMNWNQADWNTELLEIFRRLIKLRGLYAALRGDHRQTIIVGAHIYHYARTCETERVDVVLSTGSSAASVSIPSGETPVFVIGDAPTSLSANDGGDPAHETYWTIAPGSGVLFAGEPNR